MTLARKVVRASITSWAMPSRLATYLATPTLQQPLSCQRFETAADSSSGSQTWSVTPWTSKPCSTRRAAATELSTPPLIPRITVGRVMVSGLSGREVLGLDVPRVRSQVVDVLDQGRGGFLVHRLGCPHVTDALKVGALFHRKGRGMDFADEDAGLEELHLFDRGDGAVDFAAADQRPRGDDPLEDRMLSHHEGPLGVNLALEASIDADRAVEAHHTLEIDASPEKGEVLLVVRAVFLVSVNPHVFLLQPGS